MPVFRLSLSRSGFMVVIILAGVPLLPLVFGPACRVKASQGGERGMPENQERWAGAAPPPVTPPRAGPAAEPPASVSRSVERA